MSAPECETCGAPIPSPETGFAVIDRRLTVVARIVTANEWIHEEAYDEARGILRDLEHDLLELLNTDERRAA